MELLETASNSAHCVVREVFSGDQHLVAMAIQEEGWGAAAAAGSRKYDKDSWAKGF